MKIIFAFTMIVALFICSTMLFAKEDNDIPYLSDADIAALEAVLPEDMPAKTTVNNSGNENSYDISVKPVKETVVMRLDTGKQITIDEIQKLFTALSISYLKNNTNYMLSYEIYRDRRRQNLESSLVITEANYVNFTLIKIRYAFSNGYFELKFSRHSFFNASKNEQASSINYKTVGQELYAQINNRLQEICYISRGYASEYRVTSSASFYWFK